MTRGWKDCNPHHHHPRSSGNGVLEGKIGKKIFRGGMIPSPFPTLLGADPCGEGSGA